MRLNAAISLGDLAGSSGTTVVGDASWRVCGLASLGRARADELSFVRSAAMRDQALASAAGALVVPRDFGAAGRPCLVAENVDLAVARISDAIVALTQPAPPAGAHPSAVLAPLVALGEGASVGPNAVLEPGVSVGARARIGAGCYLGRDVAVGDDTVLHPNVTVYGGCRVGARCIVHAGAVIGADGFGYGRNPDGSYRKINQIGIVVVEDDVEIGACTCIDRAALDATVIGRGVKLDNLVHIAHNCVVGEHTAMAAQVGIAGSTTIGPLCEFGGQSGVVGHVSVGARVRVGAATPVIKSVADGVEVWGFPARPKDRALREMAGAASGAGRLADDLRELRRRVDEIERSRGGE